MNRKQKTILIIIIVVLAVLVVLFFLGGRRKITPGPQATTTPEASLPADVRPKFKPMNETELKEARIGTQVLAIARTFAERYGSFSNQAGFSNLLDLEPIVSKSLWADLQSFHLLQQKEISKEYYGASTKVISVKLGKFDIDSFAEISAQTQREEARGATTNPRVYYQELKLQLVKVGDNWLVDTAKWQ